METEEFKSRFTAALDSAGIKTWELFRVKASDAECEGAPLGIDHLDNGKGLTPAVA